MINIPLVDNGSDFDCCSRFYRRAIYNTLLKLKPKYSLEIGSYTFQSSAVWSRYIKEQMPQGKLITCDIAKWTNSPPPENVIQTMVYPHIPNIRDNHGGIDIYYKDFIEKLDEEKDSVSINVELIGKTMDELDISNFQLAFVDGDHSRKSFIADLEIAKILTSYYGYILIDDINDRSHVQYEVYRELKAKGNVFYEYENWNPNPGMALIQAKDLIL